MLISSSDSCRTDNLLRKLSATIIATFGRKVPLTIFILLYLFPISQPFGLIAAYTDGQQKQNKKIIGHHSFHFEKQVLPPVHAKAPVLVMRYDG